MKEKKKHDKSLAETPEARQPSPTTKRRQASTLDKSSNGQSEIRDLVSRRAYELYEERGGSDGEDMNDWLRAEAEVRASLGASGQGKSDTAKRRPKSNERKDGDDVPDQGKSDTAKRRPAAKRTGRRR